ncbi:MAG: DUF2520 domain-containing protein [Holophaga sp.]|nr:DUF2520 domain-containing protein [Holophaga sp.]
MAKLFSILGRGRVGRALASAWGDRVELLPGDACPEGLVLLAVPDRALEGCARRFPGRCVHLSGSFHLDGLPSAHPLTSFDGQPADWSGTPLGLTGPVPEVVVGAFMALGFLPFQLPPERKALYHACAVLTSGHASALWLGAAGLLAQAGVDLPGRGLIPLAEATVRNLERHGAAGRTGPFVRGDVATIDRDAAALPEPWRDIFLRLGQL